MPAQDPVARVQSLIWMDGHVSPPGVQVGRFYPLRPGISDGSGLPSMKVAAVVIRGKEFAVAAQDMPLYIQDIFMTAPGAVGAIEFLIGGRVSVNQATAVEVVNERAVADGKIGLSRALKKNASLWVKADAKTLKQPIEIQTNGGVMGIKG